LCFCYFHNVEISYYWRPGHCPEIPEILKVAMKCPEFFADVLKFFNTPVNGASVHL